MTQEEFAEWLRRLVGEAEDTGLELQEMIVVLQDQAEAMRIAYEEWVLLRAAAEEAPGLVAGRRGWLACPSSRCPPASLAGSRRG